MSSSGRGGGGKPRGGRPRCGIDNYREEIERCFENGDSMPSILLKVNEWTGQSISQRTLRRRITTWGLREPQTGITDDLVEHVRLLFAQSGSSDESIRRHLQNSGHKVTLHKIKRLRLLHGMKRRNRHGPEEGEEASEHSDRPRKRRHRKVKPVTKPPSRTLLTLGIQHPDEAVVASIRDRCLESFTRIVAEDGRGATLSCTVHPDPDAVGIDGNPGAMAQPTEDSLVEPHQAAAADVQNKPTWHAQEQFMPDPHFRSV